MTGGKIFKKEGDLKPRQVRYWLNPKVESAAESEEQTTEICEIYAKVGELAAQGIKVYSTDDAHGAASQRKVKCGATAENRKSAARGI